jgi:hypothetical protein
MKGHNHNFEEQTVKGIGSLVQSHSTTGINVI